MIGARRDRHLISCGGRESRRCSCLAAAVAIGVLTGLLIAFSYPYGFFVFDPLVAGLRLCKSTLQASKSECESSERIRMLEKQIRELNEKLKLAEHGEAVAQKQLRSLGKQPKVGPFGTVRALRTNPTLKPDESVNPRLGKILQKVAVNKEVVVVLANSRVKEILELWHASIKRVGIPNYLIVALDDEIEGYCKSNGLPFYKRDPDEGFDSIARAGSNHAVSGLKFHVLREFLQMGYSVLLSDVDTVYLQNPFDHLYRDSDIESMTDGHDNATAYGYDYMFDEPAMGWPRYSLAMIIWVYNSGFFYIRPTLPSIELLDPVAYRLAHEDVWDQAAFNEELYYPSQPGYDGSCF